MDDSRRNLQGSKKRDIFKRKHKDYNPKLYATDVDFVWIEKYPPGVVAYVDYKGSGEGVTFTEAILYNHWIKTTPVYIVMGNNPETGPFTVMRYEGGDWRPNPPITKLRLVLTCQDWQELCDWENQLRSLYRQCNGQLPKPSINP